jgi:YbgC/YbaW family acyl-CoA thioester hydrolase
MPRLKIDLPAKNLVTVSIPVRITDINYGNHVGNNAIVEIIHEARVQFLQKHGFTELNVAGIALIMSELLVDYKNESFYGDVLEVNIFIGEITRVSFELFYQISTTRKEKKITIALAKTGMVSYNYETKKVTAVSGELRSILL